MPNGGSDCCGTCWFNRKNEGEAGYGKGRDSSIEPYCDIRGQAIENPLLHLLRQPSAPSAGQGQDTNWADFSVCGRLQQQRQGGVGRVAGHGGDSAASTGAIGRVFHDGVAGQVSHWARYWRGRSSGNWVEFREERGVGEAAMDWEEVPGRWGELAREAVGRIEGG